MTSSNLSGLGRISKNPLWLFMIFSGLFIVMGNLNALVDAVLHPDIPYFYTEHLIVGGVTGLVSGVLFGLLFLYVRHIDKALGKIQALESVLTICAHCKRIRRPGANPGAPECWQPLESYITAKMTTEFSHGICPDCLKKFYPQFYEKLSHQDTEK